MFITSGLDPEGLITGGGTESRTLEPSGLRRERGRIGEGVDPPLTGGGSGGPPPEIFEKSMSLRMHFKPF